MKKFLLPVLTLALASGLISGCGGGSSTSSSLTSFGSNVSIGEGTARSFVVKTPSGDPSVVGFTLSQKAYDSFQVPLAPAAAGEVQVQHAGAVDEAAGFVLPLPASANTGVINHIELDWEPSGHPPAVYSVPHFDVHFYMISEGERALITPGSDSTPAPAESQLPIGYFSTVDVVPNMGVHYVDGTSSEFQPGNVFTETFIYGFFKDDMVFMEPMLAKSWLDTKPTVSTAIKQPATVKRSGWYPTIYNVAYNQATKQYTISLSNFVYRTAVN